MYFLPLFLILSLEQAFSLLIKKPNSKLQDYESLFEEFTKKYEIKYLDEQEKLLRYEEFVKKFEDINQLNAESAQSDKITEFDDEEISRILDDPCEVNCDLGNVDELDVPEEEEFDWRKHNDVLKNVLNNVKDQQYCYSSWAFAAIANIEAQYAMKYNKSLILSEQQLVDCDIFNKGCDGGEICYAYRSIMHQGGVMTENDYPYNARNQTCKKNIKKSKAKISGCKYYQVTEEEKIKALIKHVGPLTIGVQMRDLVNYDEGVVEYYCPPEIKKTTHAVLIVGWGSENGKPYWIFKNSFDKSWGENGYFRMKRDVNSSCLLVSPLTTAIIL